MSINKLILTPSTTIHDAILALDKSGAGFLPVVDDKNLLIGIITDGDIRRALLGNTLDLEHIINRKPKTLPSQTPKTEIIRTLKTLHLRHMPIVDEAGKLIDVIFLENLFAEPKPNKVIIMAGGMGTRLGDLTKDIPKPMLPINGRPILEHIIENLKFQGFTRFILCLNHKSEVIQQYFNHGEKLGVHIEYTYENKRLGTAGALSLIDKKMISEPFFVLNADVIAHIDFDDVLKFHVEQNAIATMCIKPQAYEIPYACVEFDDKMELKSLVEKPKVNNYINAGIYVLNPEVLKDVPQDEFFDMPTLFQEIIDRGQPAKVFKFEEYWIDIGRPTDYSKANTDLI